MATLISPRTCGSAWPWLSSARCKQLVAARQFCSPCSIASLLLFPCVPCVRAPYLSSFINRSWWLRSTLARRVLRVCYCCHASLCERRICRRSTVSRSWWRRSTFARQLVAAQYFGSACIASLLLLPRVPCVRAPHLSSFHRLPQLVAAQYLGSACIASLLLWPCIPFVRAPYLSSFHRLPQLVAARYLGLPCRVILLSNAG